MTTSKKLAVCFVAAMALVLAPATEAANPTGGTLNDTSPPGNEVTWVGDQVLTPSASASCPGGATDPSCDHFFLTILPPAGTNVRVTITIDPLGQDYDLEVRDPSGNVVGSSGNAPALPEIVTINNPAGGVYSVDVAPFAGTGLYNGIATMEEIVVPPPPPPGTDNISYSIHAAPSGVGNNAGEPSIGTNWNTGRLMFLAGLETLWIEPDHCTSPPSDMNLWANRSALNTSIVTLDPIGFTDEETGRTIISQLSAKCSNMSYSDDDGFTWLPSQGCGINSGVDHQTVRGGDFAFPLTNPPAPAYPNAVYYCSQDAAIAQCARSDTGSATFGAAVPAWTAAQCGGLHGTLMVAPDTSLVVAQGANANAGPGTVAVPNRNCNGELGMGISFDNGNTWEVRTIPGTASGANDATLEFGSDGTLYLGGGSGGVPTVAVSQDYGLTWDAVVDVSDGLLKSTAFPEMAAGDGDRAVMYFLGAKEPGGNGDQQNSGHFWHAYAAHTYDRGLSWTLVKMTDNDHVQKNSTICAGGIGCANGTRNLLDFNDAEIDLEGRGLFGFADGCTGACATSTAPNTYSEKATYAVQTNGRRLFAAFDDFTDPPDSPQLSVTCDGPCDPVEDMTLEWSVPDDRGNGVTEYHVYRNNLATLVASVPVGVNSYLDSGANGGDCYAITAENANGEGLSCQFVCGQGEPPPPPEDICTVPGVTIVNDLSGDQDATLGTTQHDIEWIKVAEPFPTVHGGNDELVISMKVADLTELPLATVWRTYWTNPADSTVYFVSMASPCTVPTDPPDFNYGFQDGNIFTSQGDPNFGTFSADGTITIHIDQDLVGNTDVGSTLTAFQGQSELILGAACSGLIQNMDTTDAGSHVVQGNLACSNQPPTTMDDFASTLPSTQVNIDVLANDSDPDGDPLTVEVTLQPVNGLAVVAADVDGDFVQYTPGDGFVGVETFEYTVNDGKGLESTATVEVTVDSVGCSLANPIFTDGFESGNIGAWSQSRDPQGDRIVDAAGALAGNFGARFLVDHNPPGTDERESWIAEPLDAPVDDYCFAFRFDPSGLTLPDGQLIKIFGARHEGNQRLLDMAIKNISGTLNVGFKTLKDNGNFQKLPFVPIPNGPSVISGEWVRSPSAGVGGELRLYVDGVLGAEVTGINNGDRQLLMPGLGNMGLFRPGTVGELRFDDFLSGSTP